MEKALSIIATIFCYIAGFIYNVFRYVYRVFSLVASAKLVDNDVYRGLARNIYVLIGVIALFLAAYSLLTAIADPEGAAKSKNSPVKLVQNVLITIVLIAFVPTIFNFAFNVQGIIMKNNLIGEVLTVDGGEQTISDDFANSIWNMFYKVDPEGPSSASSIHPNKLGPNDWFPDTNLEQTQEKVSSGEKTFLEYARYGDAIANQEIDVDWLLLIGMGCACVYLFISFSIDMGVRAIKLAFYQIIAPIPILTRIIPGQNKVFDNWLKGTMSTFFEVFIRVGAVALGVTLINFVFKWNITWVTDMSDITGTMKVFAQAILIIGILIFIKQAPKFICDMFGIQSGSFKLGIADKLGEMAGVGTFAKDTLNSAKGAAAGALGAGYQAAWSGGDIKKAMKAGATQGWKGKGFGQFNAQRQATYGLEGGKGKVGLFGRQAFMDKAADDTKDAYRDDYQYRVLSERVNKKTDISNPNNRIAGMYSGALSRKKTAREENIARLEAELDKLKANNQRNIEHDVRVLQDADSVYEADKQVRLNSIESELSSKRASYNQSVDAAKATFEADKQVRLNSIESELSSKRASYNQSVNAAKATFESVKQSKLDSINSAILSPNFAHVKQAIEARNIFDTNKQQQITNLSNRLLDASLSIDEKQKIESEIGRLQSLNFEDTAKYIDISSRFSESERSLMSQYETVSSSKFEDTAEYRQISSDFRTEEQELLNQQQTISSSKFEDTAEYRQISSDFRAEEQELLNQQQTISSSKFEDTKEYKQIKESIDRQNATYNHVFENVQAELQKEVDSYDIKDQVITKYVYDPATKSTKQMVYNPYNGLKRRIVDENGNVQEVELPKYIDPKNKEEVAMVRVSKLEKEAYEASVKELADADETFKRENKVVTAKNRERETTAWLNTDEGIRLTAAMGKNFDKLPKNNSGGSGDKK